MHLRMLKKRRRSIRRAATTATLVLLGGLLGAPREGAAQSSNIRTWNGSVNNLWGTADNWSPDIVPNSSAVTAVIANPASNPVLIDISPTVGNLTVGAANSVLLGDGGTLTIAGGVGTGIVSNAGSITLGSVSSWTNLVLGGDAGSTITLTGGGTLTLSNSFDNRIYSNNGGSVLVNDTNNVIQGSGQVGIGSSSYGFSLTNKGTIDANQATSMMVAPSSTITNTGTLEATAGGTMSLIATVDNTGGVIQASDAGSAVNLYSATITGGTITTASGGMVQNKGGSTIRDVAISSGSTLTLADFSSTILGGTIANSGTIAMASSLGNTDLILDNHPLEITGGTLAMSNSFNNRIYSNNGAGSLTVDAGAMIQGSGQVGINSGSYGFTLTNKGTIDANQSTSMMVAPSSTIANTGTLEATAGGTMNLVATVNNAGGVIQATDAGSVVNLNGATITGGTITTASGGVVQNNGGATIRDVAVSGGSTLTLADGSSTILGGTIANGGTIALASTGSTTNLILDDHPLELSGGILSLSNNFNNRIYSNNGAGSLTVDADATIRGAGQVGIYSSSYGFTLTNKGTIDANQSTPMQIAPSSTIANTGTLEATAGGTMNLVATVNNAGGVIQATDAGSVVNLNGATITGGTITTASGGVVQNNGGATIRDVAVSGGSTLTLADGSSTTLGGTITGGGTVALASTGSTTNLILDSHPLELSGVTLALTDNFNNRIYSNNGAGSLTVDADATIRGAGQVGIGSGSYGFTLTNKGMIQADGVNQLQIAPTGDTTNLGTFQANAGSTLFMNGNLTNYNAATSTLTGGAYIAHSGTIELSGANQDAGHAIATNAATILLDGASAKIADAGGNDIVNGALTANAAAGVFTIQNGADLTTSAAGFSNAGAVHIGGESILAVGGSNDYVQTAGLTTLDTASSRLVVAPGQSVDINGGTLQGFGTVVGNLVNGGTVHPGGSPGILTVNGNYTQAHGGTLAVDLAGPAPGTGYSQLAVVGTAALDGILNISLTNGFTPFVGETFILLTSSGLSGTFSTINGLNQGGMTFMLEYSPNGFPNDVVLVVTNGAVPEPASAVTLGLGVLCLGAYARRARKAARPAPEGNPS